ncbi:hypothetical protein F2Q69_00053082 [Brassica cretica]|uniref:Uncharacterized protein n=1 Tax=Brassica cretica TaxID=69181 RepID=A0A8S9N089_BRACR|nr:hypothetical protein F2Q69_00053082 [Brassica cretica]
MAPPIMILFSSGSESVKSVTCAFSFASMVPSLISNISPLRSVHQWLQTNLKQLLLHVKQVTRDVYVLEHRFELIINLDLSCAYENSLQIFNGDVALTRSYYPSCLCFPSLLHLLIYFLLGKKQTRRGRYALIRWRSEICTLSKHIPAGRQFSFMNHGREDMNRMNGTETVKMILKDEALPFYRCRYTDWKKDKNR